MAEIINFNGTDQRGKQNNETPLLRWKARVTYRSSKAPDGLLVVEHLFEEIEDLDPLIEDGPHWGTIVNIHITNNAPIPGQSGPGFTIEKAELL